MKIKMEGIVESETDSSLVNSACGSACWSLTATARRVRDAAGDSSTVYPNNTTTMAFNFAVSAGVANAIGNFGGFDGNVELIDVRVKDEDGLVIAVAGLEDILTP